MRSRQWPVCSVREGDGDVSDASCVIDDERFDRVEGGLLWQPVLKTTSAAALSAGTAFRQRAHAL